MSTPVAKARKSALVLASTPVTLVRLYVEPLQVGLLVQARGLFYVEAAPSAHGVARYQKRFSGVVCARAQAEDYNGKPTGEYVYKVRCGELVTAWVAQSQLVPMF